MVKLLLNQLEQLLHMYRTFVSWLLVLQVAKMQIELEELQPKLVVAQADNEKMMVVS